MTRLAHHRARHRHERIGRGAVRATAAAAALVLAGSTPAHATGRAFERVSGQDRYETAVAISQQQFPSGSDVVVVVDGLDFPDALTAAPAAGAFGAPVLLVGPTFLPGAVRAEVQRLRAERALVVGGAAAVGGSDVAELQAMGLRVARVSGADRYATAARLATTVVCAGVSCPEVLVASGASFADGLAAGAYGAATSAPLFLTAPDALPAATAAALAALHPASITVLGGTAAVSDTVMGQLATTTTGSVRRVAGADRYGTAAAIQQELWQSAPAVLLASGASFPDALAGGALGAPMLLSRPDCLPACLPRLRQLWTRGAPPRSSPSAGPPRSTTRQPAAWPAHRRERGCRHGR